MHTWDRDLLGRAQSEFVRRQLGTPMFVDDLSWGIVDTKVLQVRAGNRDVIVKTAGKNAHHIGREITANESYTAPLVASDRTGRLVATDRTLNILITEYQSGVLMEGTAHEFDPEMYAQAGAILRTLHDQVARVDDEYEFRVTQRALDWLDQPHRIALSVEAEARRILAAYHPAPITVVPTHGDWHPRNWLVDGDRVRVIDFGRFAFRPAATDLCRMAMKQWHSEPTLEAAFFAGYGTDPRDGVVWRMDLLREAVGTACWAYQVGDTDFEAHGHRLLDAAVARF